MIEVTLVTTTEKDHFEQEINSVLQSFDGVLERFVDIKFSQSAEDTVSTKYSALILYEKN